MNEHDLPPGYDVNPDWVPGPWMREKVASAIFEVVIGGADHNWVVGPKGQVLSIPLGGYNTDDGSEQDFTCDKCDKVDTTGLWTFALQVPLPAPVDFIVAVTGGLCDACATQEGAKPRKEE